MSQRAEEAAKAKMREKQWVTHSFHPELFPFGSEDVKVCSMLTGFVRIQQDMRNGIFINFAF